MDTRYEFFLGFDLGLNSCGACCLAKAPGEYAKVALMRQTIQKAVTKKARGEGPDYLVKQVVIYQFLAQFVAEVAALGCAVVAAGHEDCYFQANARTMKRLAEASGMAKAVCYRELGIMPFEVASTTAKKAATGSGAATKFGVQQALIWKFGYSVDANVTREKVGLGEHELDACAVACAVMDAYVAARLVKTGPKLARKRA